MICVRDRLRKVGGFIFHRWQLTSRIVGSSFDLKGWQVCGVNPKVWF